MFGERGEVREKGSRRRVSEMVGMKADEVTRVEPQHGGQTIALAKTGKEWRIEKPIQARADNAQVQQVLDSLLKGTLDHVVEEKITDYKQYGLDKPSFQVTFTDAKGHQKVLQLGARTHAGSRSTPAPRTGRSCSCSTPTPSRSCQEEARRPARQDRSRGGPGLRQQAVHPGIHRGADGGEAGRQVADERGTAG